MAAPTTHHHTDVDGNPMSTAGSSFDPFTLFPGDNDTTTGLTYLDWSGEAAPRRITVSPQFQRPASR